MPLKFPKPGVEGIKHVSYMALDQDNHAVIVNITLEADDQHGFAETAAMASEKYDAGDFSQSGTQRVVEVKTTDFKHKI